MSIQNLHVKQLIVFRSLLETSSVTETARRLEMKQATVSHILNKLRRELDDELFVMDGRNIMATPRALSLKKRLHNSLSVLEKITAQKVFDPEIEKAEFTTLAMEYFVLLRFHNFIQNIKPFKKNITIKYVTPNYSLGEIQSMVEKYNVDCCIDTTAIPDNHQSDLIDTEKLVLLFHPSNSNIHPNLTQKEYLKLDHIGVNVGKESSAVSALFSKQDPRGEILRVDGLLSIFSVIETTPNYVSLTGEQLAATYAKKFGLQYQESPLDLPKLQGYITWPKVKNSDPKNIWLRQQIMKSFNSEKLGAH